MKKVSIVVYVYGTVQGVGFRFATQQQAKRLGVTGYVKNLYDGSVEVFASGDQKYVDELLDWLRQGGPKHAKVDRVLTEPRAEADFAEFKISY